MLPSYSNCRMVNSAAVVLDLSLACHPWPKQSFRGALQDVQVSEQLVKADPFSFPMLPSKEMDSA
ncbi:hypothetical protein AOLI_G00303770 [Acnodon oligacanthus]